LENGKGEEKKEEDERELGKLFRVASGELNILGVRVV